MPTDVTAEPMIRVFGGIGVTRDDGPVSIGGPKQRRPLALLAVRAVRAGTVVSIHWPAEYLQDVERGVSAGLDRDSSGASPGAHPGTTRVRLELARHVGQAD